MSTHELIDIHEVKKTDITFFVIHPLELILVPKECLLDKLSNGMLYSKLPVSLKKIQKDPDPLCCHKHYTHRGGCSCITKRH